LNVQTIDDCPSTAILKMQRSKATILNTVSLQTETAGEVVKDAKAFSFDAIETTAKTCFTRFLEYDNYVVILPVTFLEDTLFG
jgi:hypothetical protein